MMLVVSWFGKWLNLRSCSSLGMCGTILSSGNTSTPPSTWCVKIFNPSIRLVRKNIQLIHPPGLYKYSTHPSPWFVKIFQWKELQQWLSFQAPYLEKKLRKIYEGEAYKFYRQSDKVSQNQVMLIVWKGCLQVLFFICSSRKNPLGFQHALSNILMNNFNEE